MSTDIAPAPSARQQTGIGARIPRHDAADYVTGRIEYFDDTVVPGTLHVALVRSPHPRASIRGIDTGRAAAAAGVVAVLGAGDLLGVGEIPHNVDPAGIGGQHTKVTALADGEVFHVGHAVAAVVAQTSGDAEAAAALVDVDYEVLPYALSVADAVAPNAPVLVPGWRDNVIAGGTMGDGDVDAALAAADHVITGSVSLHRAAPCPLETRGYLAQWDRRARRLTFRGTAQNPHQLRWHLATALGLGEQQVHVVAPRSGGSFGAKMHGQPEEVLFAALARQLERPVKWVEHRRDAFAVGGRELAAHYTASCRSDGVVTGLRVAVDGNLGSPSAAPGWGMVMVGCLTIPNGYAIPAVDITWRAVTTSKAPWNGVRSYGKEIAHTVLERLMDQVAARTELAPEEVRRRNWVHPGAFPHRTPTGLDLDSGDYQGLLRLVAGHVDLDVLRAEQHAARAQGRLVGLGWGFELVPESVDLPGSFVGGMDSSTVRMDANGHVTVLTGVTSPGSGNDTGIAQLVAGELGVPITDLDVVQGDTDRCPYGFGNLSSRSIVAGGSAAVLAARVLAERLRIVAAAMLHTEPSDIRLVDGMAFGPAPEQAVPIAAVAHAVYTLAFILALGIEPSLESTQTYRPGGIRHLPDDKGRINPLGTYSNALALAVVEIDPETGAVDVRRFVLAHDCGTQVNPTLVEAQLHGGVAMGLSTVLSEEAAYTMDGQPVAAGFKTYLLARSPDLPRVELLHQCTPSPVTLLGTKGAGESGVGAAMAATLNAVNDALSPRGVEIDSTPLTPERVFTALVPGAGR